MRRGLRVTLIGAACLAALAAGVVAYSLLRNGDAAALAQLSQERFADPSGEALSLAQWKGTPLLVNFWATWCEPCREEVPELVRAQQRYGKSVQVVGIGIDSAPKIAEFAKTYSINYPLAVAGPEVIDLTRRLGNNVGGLPYTLAIDASGRVRSSHLGGMSGEVIDTLARAAQR